MHHNLIRALALTVSLAATSSASASVMATFEYSGTADFQFGSPVAPLTSFPAGGASNVAGPPDIDTGDPRDFSARVGFGQVTPQLSYGAGAVAAGAVNEIRSKTTLELKITNDTGVAKQADWKFLIFGGAAGLNTPNFASAGCSASAIDQCDSWLNNLTDEDIGAGDSIQVNFSVDLTSSTGTESLMSGEIVVAGSATPGGAATQTATFSTGFALDGFTENFLNYSWDETLLERSLGEFAVDEMKTLTFVTETIAKSTGACDAFGPPFGDCKTAYGGFGDPPGAGGVVMYRSASTSSYPTIPVSADGSVVFSDPGTGANPLPPQAPTGSNPPTGTVPLPASALLFLTGFAPMLWLRRRRKR